MVEPSEAAVGVGAPEEGVYGMHDEVAIGDCALAACQAQDGAQDSLIPALSVVELSKAVVGVGAPEEGVYGMQDEVDCALDARQAQDGAQDGGSSPFCAPAPQPAAGNVGAPDGCDVQLTPAQPSPLADACAHEPCDALVLKKVWAPSPVEVAVSFAPPTHPADVGAPHAPNSQSLTAPPPLSAANFYVPQVCDAQIYPPTPPDELADDCPDCYSPFQPSSPLRTADVFEETWTPRTPSPELADDGQERRQPSQHAATNKAIAPQRRLSAPGTIHADSGPSAPQWRLSAPESLHPGSGAFASQLRLSALSSSSTPGGRHRARLSTSGSTAYSFSPSAGRAARPSSAPSRRPQPMGSPAASTIPCGEERCFASVARRVAKMMGTWESGGQLPSVPPQAWTIMQVADWIDFIGYPRYRKHFIEACIEGRNLSTLTVELLRGGVGVVSLAHRMSILDEVQKLPWASGFDGERAVDVSAYQRKMDSAQLKNRWAEKIEERERVMAAVEYSHLQAAPPLEWTPQQSCDCVDYFGYPQYRSNFAHAGVNGRILSKLTPHILRDELGVSNAAHVRTLMDMIRQLDFEARPTVGDNSTQSPSQLHSAESKRESRRAQHNARLARVRLKHLDQEIHELEVKLERLDKAGAEPRKPPAPQIANSEARGEGPWWERHHAIRRHGTAQAKHKREMDQVRRDAHPSKWMKEARQEVLDRVVVRRAGVVRPPLPVVRIRLEEGETPEQEEARQRQEEERQRIEERTQNFLDLVEAQHQCMRYELEHVAKKWGSPPAGMARSSSQGKALLLWPKSKEEKFSELTEEAAKQRVAQFYRKT